MHPLDHIFNAAHQAQRHIILPEGDDPRVQEAAIETTTKGLARISLLSENSAPPKIDGVSVISPRECPELSWLSDEYHKLRAHKGMTAQKALQTMQDPVAQAAMRVRLGLADGTVGGAVTTTAKIVRNALQIVGAKPGISTVSSFFLMISKNGVGPFEKGVIFSDCGLIIDPNADELAAIALASAQSCESLLGQKPQVALLSFSTAGSAEHESLHKIRAARDLVRAARPSLNIDGEIQFDAALDASIRARKAPQSILKDSANVFVFPNLAAGNIGYKIAERLGDVVAVGPILQGLNKPANDLSRGCSAKDIVATVALSALQCEKGA